MTLHIFNDIEQGTDAWFDVRRGIVTASVVGKLLTPNLKVADNETSRGLIATLAAERIAGWTEPSYTNADMMRGILHEPFARDRYAEVNGVKVEQIGFMVREWRGFKLGASPDGLIGDDGGLEVKCPRAKSHVATIIADEVPTYYMAQIQASLLVSGRKWWDFVSFCAGLPMFTKRVLPDPDWYLAIHNAVESAEESIAALTETYLAAAEHLPETEPIPDFDDIQVA